MLDPRRRASRTVHRRPPRHPDLASATLLHQIADRLRSAMAAERVILFGSVARGQASQHSDIDLLVVAPTAAPGYLRMARAHEAIRDLSVGLPVTPIVLTPAEVAQRLAAGDPFVREIVQTGIEL